MHGFIHLMLKQFATAALGEEGWHQAVKGSGVRPRVYSATGSYPDEEAVAIVVEASKISGKSVEELLELFGEFIVPKLLENFSSLINPKWTTKEFLLNTEQSIHEVIRSRDPDAKPPKLTVKEIGPNHLEVHYESPRGLLPVGLGIIRAVGNHYNQKLDLTMLPGKTGVTVKIL